MADSTYHDEKHNDSREAQMIEHKVLDHPIDPNEETEISILDAVKTNWKVLIYCVMMTAGPLMYGYDSIIVGVCTAIPSFQSTYGELVPGSSTTLTYILPSVWLALWNALTQVGVMIGSAINGPLTDRFGRRVSFLLGGIIGCGAIAVVYFSDHASTADGRRGAFLAGKILLGIALGILQSTCQIYISEIAPPRLRGPLLSIFQFFLLLGQVISVVIIFQQIKLPSQTAYRVAFASQWAFAGFAVVISFLVPESPTYCMKRNNVQGARKSFEKLHDPSTVDASVATLQATLEHERSFDALTRGIGYLECFKGTNWRRTRIVWYVNFLQQCMGITLVANSTYFLELGGMSPSHSVLVLCIGVGLSLPANVASWFTITIFGRRTILLVSTVWVGFCWLSVGIAGCFKTTGALWYMGVMLDCILIFCSLGVGSIYPVVAAETSSVRLRAKTSSLGFLMNGFASGLFNFFVPYLFNADQLNWGGKCGFFFFGLSMIAAVILYFELPEMKNRTYRELDEMFEARLKTRAFRNHVCVVTTQTAEA